MTLNESYFSIINKISLYIILIISLINYVHSFSTHKSRSNTFKTKLCNTFHNLKEEHIYKRGEHGDVPSDFSNIHRFFSDSLPNEVHCGEIVLGTPLERNTDGSILVDVGLSQPLIASKSSLYFMNEDEHYRLNTLLTKREEKLNYPNSPERIIYETIYNAKQIPERKKKTYLKPKYPYPYDYINSLRKKEEKVPYDIGVGREIRPQDYTKPLEIKTPEFLKNRDKMEFVITDINPYSKYMYGDFFSVNILETKRKIYSLMFLDSLGQKSHFIPLDGLITELMDDVVKVQLTNCRRSEMYGVNAFAMRNVNDKIGDKIKVYLAGSEMALEQVYLFRNQVSHPMLRKENLKLLIDSIIKHYVRSGKWFKAEVDKIKGDVLTLRLFGEYNNKYCAYIDKNNLPYNFPEDVLNYVFIQSNMPHEYFVQKDAEISIGKLNYIYSYDNSLYVRANELFSNTDKDISTITEINEYSLTILTTTKNYYKPNEAMKKYFMKMLNQDSENIDIKTGLTYPCIVIGNEGGVIYFAINDKFKSNFTVDDDYYIGVLEAGPYASNVPVGTTVHATLSEICKLKINGTYTVESIGNDFRLSVKPITEWLNNLSDTEKRVLKIENKKNLTLLMMNAYATISEDSPQMNEFFCLQPFMDEAKFAGYIDNEEFVDSLLNPEIGADFSFKTSFQTENNEKKEKTGYFSSDLYELNIRNDNEQVAPPIFYTHNDELRRIYLKENLDPSRYKKVLRNIDSAKCYPHLVMREFFINSKGVPYWEFLDRLTSPLERRKIAKKEALEFERSILKFLSLCHTFCLESIYDMVPKEDIMFSTIVPSSLDNTYFTAEELRRYYDIVRKDFSMDRAANKSIINLLKILLNPNYSFMALLRNRHRLMLNDVFFYSSKSLNYDSHKMIYRPYLVRDDPNNDIPIPLDEEEASSIPMMPYKQIMLSPKSFINELQVHGLPCIRKIYSELIKSSQPSKSKLVKPSHVDDTVEDFVVYPDEVKEYDPELRRMFEDFDINEYALNNLDGSKSSLKELSKGWKRLNRYPESLSIRDLKEYLEDIQKINKVHGLKIPII